MKIRLAVLLATLAGIGGIAAMQASPALASGYCHGGPVEYVNSPSPGYITYGISVACTSRITHYTVSFCLHNASTGANVPGTCSSYSGSPSWTVYSLYFTRAIYLTGVPTYTQASWNINLA